ncbi:MAG: dienelactone hydrolase family protein [Hormoscilla sp. GUM202]|nr:dienelactone hydrolase family protein [Hormoscilla sp. GUM202]
MADPEIRTAQVQVPNGDLHLDAYLAQPAASGTFPAVVVIQEIFGVNAHIREVTERIASDGYVAIAPAIYQRIAPGFEAGYTPEDITIGKEYKAQTKAEELKSDIQATIDYLKQHAEVARSARGRSEKSGFGCIGFCFGGHVAYLAATLPEIQATASFYGAGITNWSPGDGPATITCTPEIKGTIYGFFGMEDASIPAAQVDQIEAELQKHRISHRIFRYDGADRAECSSVSKDSVVSMTR